MKQYKRYLALICALLLAVCVFTGCSATANTKAAYDTAAPETAASEAGGWIDTPTADAPAAAEEGWAVGGKDHLLRRPLSADHGV